MERPIDRTEAAALATPHRSGSPLVVNPDRAVRLSSVDNFRDLAEAPGPFGSLRPGLIYRSDALHRCTQPEIDQLVALGIRRILDLRTDAECEAANPFRPGGIVIVRLPMSKDVAVLGDRSEHSSRRTLSEFYLDLAATNSGAIVLCIAEILAAARADEPLVIQSSTGTDRTGIVAAMTLALAGVDDRRIALDYARSVTADPQTMLDFLGGIRRHYGSVEDFLAWSGTDRSVLAHCAADFS